MGGSCTAAVPGQQDESLGVILRGDDGQIDVAPADEVVDLAAEGTHGMAGHHDLDRRDPQIRKQDRRERHPDVGVDQDGEVVFLDDPRIEIGPIEFHPEDFIEEGRIQLVPGPERMQERQVEIGLQGLDVAAQRAIDAVPLPPVIAEDGDLARVGRIPDADLDMTLNRLVDQLLRATLFVNPDIRTSEIQFLKVQCRPDVVIHLGQEAREVPGHAFVAVPAEDDLPRLEEPLARELGVGLKQLGDVQLDLVPGRVE